MIDGFDSYLPDLYNNTAFDDYGYSNNIEPINWFLPDKIEMLNNNKYGEVNNNYNTYNITPPCNDQQWVVVRSTEDGSTKIGCEDKMQNKPENNSENKS